MTEGLQGIETDLVTAECIADELGTLGLLTAGLVAVHKLIALTPFRVRLLCALAVLHSISWHACESQLRCNPYEI